MPYLGKEIQYTSFVTDTFSGDGTTTQFTLSVAPASSSGLIVNIGGVLQEPEYAYTVSGVTLTLSEVSPTGTNNINVIHLGQRTDIGQPGANSITSNELATSLTNFTHDSFTGDGTTVAFTLSQTAASNSSLIVFIDGVMQEPTASFSVSGTALTFTAAPGNTTDINVIHLGIITEIGTPSAGTVGTSHLSTGKWGGDYIKLSEVQTSGTAGGGFTSGAWQTRVLNTEDNDAGGHCSLASNQFTLVAGTYRILAQCPAFDVDAHKALLYNVTDTANEILGSNSHADSANDVASIAIVQGEFTIAASKTFEIQHRCTTTKASTGLGVATSFGLSEVYTVVELWKVK